MLSPGFGTAAMVYSNLSTALDNESHGGNRETLQATHSHAGNWSSSRVLNTGPGPARGRSRSLRAIASGARECAQPEGARRAQGRIRGPKRAEPCADGEQARQQGKPSSGASFRITLKG